VAALVAWACAAGGFLAAAASAAPVSWLTYGFDAQRTGYNPSEATIGPGNVAGLHVRWRVNLGAVMIAQPVEAAAVSVHGVSTNIVYEGTEHGDFYALRASDGSVVWHTNLGSVQTGCDDMPDGVFGIGGAGAISFTGTHAGMIFVAGGDGSVHAFDLATGAEEPGWPVAGVFAPATESVYGGLTLVGNKLYVTVASHCDFFPYHGAVVAINVAKHAVNGRFYPAGPPSGGVSGGGIWGPGGASVLPGNGHVFVATGNGGKGGSYRLSDAVVELSPSLAVLGSDSPTLVGSDLDFGATPILFGPPGCPVTLAAAMNKTGVLFVYAAGALNAGPRQTLDMAAQFGLHFIGIPAWDPVTNMLYVANSTDSADGPYLHGMIALKAAPDCSLSLAWQQSVGVNSAATSPPTVADGVVYYGDGPGDEEFAFDAATGAPLWNSGSTTGMLFAAPTVANGKLFVPSWDDYLYEFSP
jgi:outer membrane protein assembly factor BamB